MHTNLIGTEYPLLRRLTRDLDWVFNRVGMERPFVGTENMWAPELDVFEKGNEFIVKADVPGLKREDIHVEVTDTELTIKGERKLEKEEKEKGYYRTERSYGSFFRSVALPPGAKIELAKAVVNDGVLEVKMPIVTIEPARRRLEITDVATVEKAAKPAA
jgi:HSP20 family protein